MKSILVPTVVIEDVRSLAQQRAVEIEFLSYNEEGESEHADRATGIFRWIAGKQFSHLIGQSSGIHWLHTASAGVDHVLTPIVRSRANIIVTDSGPAFGPAIAEFVLAEMLSATRRLPQIAAHQRKHEWIQVDQRELEGATIGIIGLGPIGLAIAKRAKSFEMKTLGLRRTDRSAENIDEVLSGPDGLQKIVENSDWLVLAAALTSNTRSLIGRSQIASMKPTAWLINIARGALVDEDALVDALKLGKLAGAILDVFAHEPLPSSSALWDFPNVIVSPHNSGGNTPTLRRRQMEIFIENARRFGTGEPLQNVVDIPQGY